MRFGSDLNPIFERMTNNIYSLLEREWIPSCSTADPTIWHRREQNQIADFIVNYTMECGHDWRHAFQPPLDDFRIQGANFICHSDGGTRAGSCSAAGWFIEAIVERKGFRHTFPCAMAGKFLKSPISSFTAEAVALEDATLYPKTLII